MTKHPIAVITGAAGGIGKVLVNAFSERGYWVIGMDQESRRANLNCWQYLQVDLQKFVIDSKYLESRLADIQQLLANDGLSVLINNAAIQILGGVSSLTVIDWHNTLDVNLLAPFLLTQGLFSDLEKANGCVINVSSIHARLTKPNFVAYATSKAALSGMTRAMAVDLGGKVRVNGIEPAAIATEMLSAGFVDQPERLNQLEACHPQGRIGSPEEVAALALSIASGDMQFMHGACISLDGGISGRLYDPI